ncbi:synaptic vesicle 2-related protein-like [Melitaea cinxia]|uniref:synaptic vesicle 2-related protein-like n=1 Tax=Melitaea cinxia TaxID=113334 RepID=UPI001E2740EA|nr:synaptic vesicle 2-related protein-like [Melitaea cinxia]
MTHGTYLKKTPEFFEFHRGKECTVWSVKSHRRQEKVYTYDEAIELAGNGWYIIGLALVLLLAFVSMSLDMFGFSVVVSSACDFELTHFQESILLSMPFLGSIFLAYPWGYISDTQGRRKGLLISLWGSYILATLSVFSPHWIVLAALKFGSASLSSGIQSLSLTLIGESCSPKIKSALLIGIPSSLFLTFGVYNTFAYFILSLDFAYDLGFVIFKPWRLLGLVLALPLSVSAILCSFFYESPKFVLNDGHEKKALNILRKISKKNGVKQYPVKRVVLQETTTLRRKDIPFLQSLMEQTFPLFKAPLLFRTLHLFFITAIIYSINNGFYSRLPLVLDTFDAGHVDNSTTDNLCDMFSNYNNLEKDGTCITAVNEFTIWASLIQGLLYCFMNVIVAMLFFKKKLILITMLFVSSLSSVLIPLLPGRILSISLFNGLLMNSLSMTIVFSYYVEMFPTSYRGMAACLGVMVARLSALAGTNLIGTYIMVHCDYTMYLCGILSLGGVVISFFLPPDKPKISSC